jgi:Thymidylate kinase
MTSFPNVRVLGIQTGNTCTYKCSNCNFLQEELSYYFFSTRFWHSTAAYAIAEESSVPQDANHWVYGWPQDLFRPTVVILLVVEEELRLQRLQTRVQTEGTLQTQEERILASNSGRRRRCVFVHVYKSSFPQLGVVQTT